MKMGVKSFSPRNVSFELTSQINNLYQKQVDYMSLVDKLDVE